MTTTRKIATITLIVLLAAILYGLLQTWQPMPTSQLAPATGDAARGPVIDLTPLHNAQRFARMATSADEMSLAQEAFRLGDREMDLAFAAGVRQAQDHPVALTAEAKESETRQQNAESTVDRDNARVVQLTAAAAKATGAEADRLDNELQQAKAQMELDQDDLDNAKQELILAGGDTEARIDELMREHDAASAVADKMTINAATLPEVDGLVHQYGQWSALREKVSLLRQAQEDAASAAAAFTTRRDVLASSIKAQKQVSAATLTQGATPAAGAKSVAPVGGKSAELVNAAKLRSADVKELTNLNERVENQKRLADTYRKWIEVVAAKQRSLAHGGLTGAGIIVAILLIGIFFKSWLKSLLTRVGLDQRQAATLHAVVGTGVQIVALCLILLVIFGPPNQLGTFLGLAGAGLTVALKDFIVSFMGWFVLMGKNGIRLGDWVEINGVTGEVVELGMFHTVLLETGNWTR